MTTLPAPVAPERDNLHTTVRSSTVLGRPKQTTSIPPPLATRVVSPSLSDASLGPSTSTSTDDDADTRARTALSPSPEIDLDLDLNLDLDIERDRPFTDHIISTGIISGVAIPPHSMTPAIASFASGRINPLHVRSTRSGFPGRGNSPPLEGDEREFTDTACAMRARGLGYFVRREHNGSVTNEAIEDDDDVRASAAMGMDVGVPHVPGLFGGEVEEPREVSIALSSPLSKAGSTVAKMEVLVRGADDWERDYGWGIGGPEAVELSELDDLFGAF